MAPRGWAARSAAVAVAASALSAAAFEVPLGHARHRRTGPVAAADPRGSPASKRVLHEGRTVDIGNIEATYFVTLEIGNPPRPFRVHLDTGSSSLFVAAPYDRCPTCDPHFDRAFDESASSTSSVLACTDPDCGTTCDPACGLSTSDIDLGSLDDDAAQSMQTQAFLGGEDKCSSVDDPGSGCRHCLEQDTCKYKGDGACDDGSDGGTAYCRKGTDSMDCDTTGSCCPATCCYQGGGLCAFHAIYGDGSGVAGKIIRDEVAFGTGKGRLGSSVFFGHFDKVHGMDAGGLFEIAAIDGIFGIGGVLLNDGRVPVLDQILGKNGLHSVFGMCLGGFAGGVSALDVGTVDTNKFKGNLMYVPFVHGAGAHAGAGASSFDYYSIGAPSRTDIVTADGSVVDLHVSASISNGFDSHRVSASDYAPSDDDALIIIDSGTTMFQVATPVYNALTSAIQSHVSESAKRSGFVEDSPGECFQAPADWQINDHYPTIRFWLTDGSGVDFALEWLPQHYFGIGSIIGEGIWCLGLADGGTGPEPSIFGDVFMEAFYVGFDRENFQLGFAPVADTCGNHVQGACTGPSCAWPVYGCTDEAYAEYDSAANAADPSACLTSFVDGCLSPNYVEYNPAANRDTSPTSCCTCKRGGYCPGVDASCPDPCSDARDACRADSSCTAAVNGGDVTACTANRACTNLLDACAPDDDSCGTDTCRYHDDNECDDGSQGGMAYCELGTDCGDCGNCCGADAGSACGTDTCRYHDDSECDDGSQGGMAYCELGTDCGDCGNCCGSGSDSCGTDTCQFHDDTECDDGSQGGYALCELGTDCGDCGNCCGDSQDSGPCSAGAMAVTCGSAKRSSVGNCIQCLLSKSAFANCPSSAVDGFCAGR